LRAVAGVEQAERAKGVRWVRLHHAPGHVYGLLRRGADRAGAILAVGGGRDEALERADRAAALLRFDTATADALVCLRPRLEDGARELRVGRAIAAPVTDRCDQAEQCALNRPWRRAEHDHVAELPADERQLQRRRHPFLVGMSEAREPVERLDHV